MRCNVLGLLDMLSLDLETLPVQQDLVRRSQVALVELQTPVRRSAKLCCTDSTGTLTGKHSATLQRSLGKLGCAMAFEKYQTKLKVSPCPDVLCDQTSYRTAAAKRTR